MHIIYADRVEDFAREARRYDRLQTVVITKDAETALRAYAEGCACVLEGSEASPFLPGIPMVTDRSALTGPFLEQTLAHRHGLPFAVARDGDILLREGTAGDFDSLREVLESADRMAFSDETTFWREGGSGEEAMEAYLAYIHTAYALWGFGLWVCFDEKRDRAAGLIGLTPWEEPEEQALCRAGLSFLLSPEYRGTGLARRLCLKVMDYARDELGLEELCAEVDEGNEKALRFAAGLGFSLRGSSSGSSGEITREPAPRRILRMYRPLLS